MGLAEKRAMKEFEENVFPDWKRKIESVFGADLVFEIHWDQLAVDNYGHLFNTAIPKIFFEPLFMAFTEIAIDQMGKDALKNGIKKIVIQNTKAAHNAHDWILDSTSLILDHHPTSNIDDVKERSSILIKMLENKL